MTSTPPPAIATTGAGDATFGVAAFAERCVECRLAQIITVAEYRLDAHFCPQPREVPSLWFSMVYGCARVGVYRGARGIVWRCSQCHVYFESAHSAAVLVARRPMLPMTTAPKPQTQPVVLPERSVSKRD
jgi:hypothetical protein